MLRVLNGKLREVVRGIGGQGQGGVIYPDDIDSNTGRPVMEVLKENPPVIQT